MLSDFEKSTNVANKDEIEPVHERNHQRLGTFDPWTKDFDAGTEDVIVGLFRLFVAFFLQVHLQKYEIAFVGFLLTFLVELFSPRVCQPTIVLWESECICQT
jgi:hypothetical protein